MKALFQRSLSFVLLVTGSALMLLLSLTLMFWLLIGTEFAPLERWLYEMEISSDCAIQNAEMPAEEARARAQQMIEAVAAKEAELADLETKCAELQQLYDRLERIEITAREYAILHKAVHRGYEVVTEHGHTSLLNGAGAKEA